MEGAHDDGRRVGRRATRVAEADARYADVTVLGQVDPAESEPIVPDELPEEVRNRVGPQTGFGAQISISGAKPIKRPTLW